MELTTLFPKSVKTLEENIRAYRAEKEHSWSMGLRRLIENSLMQESNRHSVEIEIPMVSGSPKRHMQRCRKEALHRVNEAWDYLRGAVEQEEHPELEEKNLVVASRILIPGVRSDPHTQYRADQVIINNATYAPPPPRYDPSLPDRPEHVPVPSQVPEMIDHISRLDGDFQRAIYSHFHIARIHPFADGNGRIARLAQNAYLLRGHLLPLVIPSDERDLYASIIDAGVQQYYGDVSAGNKHSRYIHPFAQYLVSKMDDGFTKFRKKKLF